MKRDKLSVWSFVLVLIAYFLIATPFIKSIGSYLGLIPFFLGVIIGITCLILSIISLRKIKKRKLKGKGLAIATIILSLILILYFLYLLSTFRVF